MRLSTSMWNVNTDEQLFNVVTEDGICGRLRSTGLVLT